MSRSVGVASGHLEWRATDRCTGRFAAALAYDCFDDDPSRRGLVNPPSGADVKAGAQRSL